MSYEPLILSAKLSALNSICLLIAAVPAAYLLSYRKFRGKFFIESIIGLPLVVPPTVLGFYLLVLMGPKGYLGISWNTLTGLPLAFTFAGILIATMVHGFPFAVQPLKASFEKIDRRLLEMASVLGLSPVRTFFKIVLPNSVSGIAAAAILVFVHTMGEFGVILMVGGAIPGKTKVASIAIYELVENLQYREAAKLSLIMLVLSYIVLLVMNYLNSLNPSRQV